MGAFSLDIPQARSWTNEDLFIFCEANPNVGIERNAQGYITIISPAGGLSSYYSGIVFAELSVWSRRDKSGLAFDSSGGFILPDGSMRSPDAAWVSKEIWTSLNPKDKIQFPPICPSFVVEVRSASDRLTVLQHKMEEWMKNGAKLGWLIDPQEKKAYVYSETLPPIIIDNFQQVLEGEPHLPGFQFDLQLLSEE